ncbi:MAG: PQQ-binding-like beta-propeller repeat protein, partial [Eubacterium sp.]|nr:PQQ-binding-like beta-propeller repeat protein [Eubacterium sp.]
MAKKQALSIILCICMLISFTFEVKQSAAATPVSSEDSALLWKAKFSDPYFMGTSMISTPVVTEDAVYIVNKDALYALDPATGKTVWELDLGRRMDSICDPILVENHLYIPLTEGVIKCVDINDQKIEWVSNDGCFEFVIDDHQTLGRLAYHDGYLYAGTWKSISSDPTRRSEGYYFCVSAADGLVQWCINGTNYLGGPSMPNYTIDGNVDDTAGFYWTEPVFTDNFIFFTSEDGYLYCLNTNYDKLGFNNYRGRIIKIQTEEEAEQEDEEQEDPKPIPDSKLFRCGLSKAEAKDCNCIYAINKGGTVYRIQYDDTSDTYLEHAFNIAQKYDLFPEIENRAKINCTCTPIVDNSTFIFGAYANGNGYLVFVDDNSDDFGSIQYSQT